ncbi:ATP-dependent Clp protease proteolytic subunit [Fulvimarina sp. 2208YS6-2-32]|uniref:ATP-dependent Clp protease proteolytic subunit n=1 Tax=Fulvimarina uroteuthidis TaxID=3098149 RepID=A0ABU5HYG9_9HYPH|nr:ATP-dependent Clp protease proteolytic subunit [Fulvimarina sp. 2208YS6-2-32]MDY8108181.1 ATP-dependent Clp protease proteolytic subunit [Fulvimarina sp. 2208YS6-2-32]
MIGEEASPGRLERLVQAIPDGAILRAIFVGLLVVSICIVYFDYRDVAEREARYDTARTERTAPMPLKRPEPGDQVRPYLPKTIPVGPDRGEPALPGYDGPVDSEAMTRPMSFFEAGGGLVSAVGRIEIGTAGELRAFLAAQAEARKEVTRLFLHSPGGSVEDALQMAADLRAAGISTEVPADGYCASACPLVFAGGLTRHAGESAWIGLHQVYAAEVPGTRSAGELDRSISEIQQTIARCQQLLADMGVSPAIWIKAMQTPPADLYVLTEEELVSSRYVRAFPDGPELIGPRRPDDFRLDAPRPSPGVATEDPREDGPGGPASREPDGTDAGPIPASLRREG